MSLVSWSTFSRPWNGPGVYSFSATSSAGTRIELIDTRTGAVLSDSEGTAFAIIECKHKADYDSVQVRVFQDSEGDNR